MMTCIEPLTSITIASCLHLALHISFFNLIEGELPPKPPKLLIDLVKNLLKLKRGVKAERQFHTYRRNQFYYLVALLVWSFSLPLQKISVRGRLSAEIHRYHFHHDSVF